MRKRKQSLIAVTALAISMTSLPAQAETLQGALSQTLARNPSLSAARSNYEALYVTQFVTLADMLPQVTAFVSETRSDTDAKNVYSREAVNSMGRPMYETDLTDSDSYGLQLTQQLFTSGKNLNAFRAKRAEIRSEEAKLTGTEQQILLSSIAAYLDVLQAQSVLQLREKNVTVLEKQLSAVKDRFSVGVVTRTDVAQSEAATAGALTQRLVAQSALHGARAVYREVVGVEADKLVKPTKLPRLPRTLDRALSIARKESPLLKTAQEMATSGKFNSISTIGSALPTINLTGSYIRNENPNGSAKVDIDTASVQVQLNVPLFRGGRSIAAIYSARDYNNALKSNIHVASNTLEREVVVAWHNVAATKSSIGATKEQIKAAELALAGVRQENRLGTRTNLDVLNAEQLRLDANVALVQAERDEYLAAYNLLATMGRLTAKRLRIKPAEVASRK
jgi:TolC family type I secretion outer membrane protein